MKHGGFVACYASFVTPIYGPCLAYNTCIERLYWIGVKSLSTLFVVLRYTICGASINHYKCYNTGNYKTPDSVFQNTEGGVQSSVERVSKHFFLQCRLTNFSTGDTRTINLRFKQVSIFMYWRLSARILLANT